jgi:hypothetical protein
MVPQVNEGGGRAPPVAGYEADRNGLARIPRITSETPGQRPLLGLNVVVVQAVWQV